MPRRGMAQGQVRVEAREPREARVRQTVHRRNRGAISARTKVMAKRLKSNEEAAEDDSEATNNSKIGIEGDDDEV
jgi:hypothetical protein